MDTRSGEFHRLRADQDIDAKDGADLDRQLNDLRARLGAAEDEVVPFPAEGEEISIPLRVNRVGRFGLELKIQQEVEIKGQKFRLVGMVGDSVRYRSVASMGDGVLVPDVGDTLSELGGFLGGQRGTLLDDIRNKIDETR